jgi:hypothetical protein
MVILKSRTQIQHDGVNMSAMRKSTVIKNMKLLTIYLAKPKMRTNTHEKKDGHILSYRYKQRKI